jgi:hypothetical protein
MRDDADETTSNRHLEAYLLWLFSYVMFYGSQGDAVSRFLIPPHGGSPMPLWRRCPRSTGVLQCWPRRTGVYVPGAPRRAPSRSSSDVHFCYTCGAMSGFPSDGHRSTDRRTGRWRRGTTQQTCRPWGRCGATARFVLRANFVC